MSKDYMSATDRAMAKMKKENPDSFSNIKLRKKKKKKKSK